MNLQQLEYIVALDAHRHFGRAAEACFVSQPTLSAMVGKLEEELGIRLFDRSKKPVVPTMIGEVVIGQARRVLAETARIGALVDQEREVVAGELRLGIIPTLAPYLLPLFVKRFISRYTSVKLKISEHITRDIVEKLQRNQLDAAVVVTPLPESSFRERVLFYEPFLVYSSSPYKKKFLLPEDLDPDKLWLLEEGHCFRTQIANLCELWKKTDPPFEYAAGSIETLKRLVETQSGITVLPQLATLNFSEDQRQMLKPFADPIPVREVSLVAHRDYVKQGVLEALQAEILAVIPEELHSLQQIRRVEIS